MRQQGVNPDQIIARIAARQHGVISYVQLLWAGLSPSGISRRVQAGRLHRIHRGVYAVGHRRVTVEGRWMAAVLACGAGAALSQRSAAELWGLLPPRRGIVDVTVPVRGGRKGQRGIRLHRSPSLPSAITRRNGIAVTNPERTILDLRRVAASQEVEAAIAQAEVLRLPIGRHEGFLHEPTRSELERAFLRLCRRNGLPRPEVNVRLGRFRPDFLWRELALIVETDGWETHGTRSAFEADRARDAQLKMMGYAVVRFTYGQVVDEPAMVVRTLRTALAAAPVTCID
jgi:very-short-patch-repair endonuclease